MQRILMVTAAVIIGVVLSQVFFNEKAPETVNQTASDSATLETSPAATQQPEIASELVSSAPANARVFFIQPTDGAIVEPPVSIEFGIENMVVAKAGENVENSGHHHLLINMETLPNLNAPLPATDQLIHFGGGQTQTSIDLPPGEHSLQLLLGNYLHIPHDKPVISEKITITVVDSKASQ